LSSISWSTGNTLTLSAYHDISFNESASISNSGAGNLILRADNADIALIGPADAHILKRRTSIVMLFWRAVHRSLVVAGVPHNGRRRESVVIDNVVFQAGNELACRINHLLEANLLLRGIFFRREASPTIEVRQGRDPHRAVVKRLVIREIVRRADHAAPNVAQFLRPLPDKLLMVVEERDRVVVAEILRLRIERGNRLAERKLPRRT
jgi:hypothetical protein